MPDFMEVAKEEYIECMGSDKADYFGDECLKCIGFNADSHYGTVYYVDEDINYIAASVCVAMGGPNIWINGYTGTEEFFWYADYRRKTLDKDYARELNDIFFDEYLGILSTIDCGHELKPGTSIDDMCEDDCGWFAQYLYIVDKNGNAVPFDEYGNE